MSKKSQDTRLKQQDCWKSLEKLVPPLELCQQIDIDCFNKSAMVWWADYNGVEIIVIPRTFVSRKEEIVAPAPTLEEIIKAIKTKTYCKDDLCDHKYDIHYCAIDLKWIFCFGENFAVADTLSSAALKLWLELNKSDLSDTDRKGGEQ